MGGSQRLHQRMKTTFVYEVKVTVEGNDSPIDRLESIALFIDPKTSEVTEISSEQVEDEVADPAEDYEDTSDVVE
jgi:hypothetical protein